MQLLPREGSPFADGSALSCVAELEEELERASAAARHAEVATLPREMFGADDPLAST